MYVNIEFGRNSLIEFLIVVTIGSIVFFIQSNSQNASAFEENLLVFQSGIISTENRDYAISNNFEMRIIQDGRIMRLSGITTTGEIYYVFQKIVDSNTIVKGKILVNDKFIPIIQSRSVVEEKQIVDIKQSMPIKMVISQPHDIYWRQIYTINVKVFEADKNPLNDYWFKEYLVPNIPILIDINHESGRHLTTIEGTTNEDGYFKGQYYVRDNLDWGGKYNVHVVAGDEANNDTEDLTTFIIGEIIGARNATGG
jgi:hypothetical protein